MGSILKILFFINNYMARKIIAWFLVYMVFEIPTLFLVIYSYLPGKDLKHILYVPAILYSGTV